MVEQGFTGSYLMVRRKVAKWGRSAAAAPALPKPRLRLPSSKSVAWMMLKDEPPEQEQERALLETLMGNCADLHVARALAQEFAQITHDRRGDALDEWIERTHAADVPRELAVFADGAPQDDDITMVLLQRQALPALS